MLLLLLLATRVLFLLLVGEIPPGSTFWLWRPRQPSRGPRAVRAEPKAATKDFGANLRRVGCAQNTLTLFRQEKEEKEEEKKKLRDLKFERKRKKRRK